MNKYKNHPYLTAIERDRISAPTRWLLRNNLLKGKILDFGCGYGFDTDSLKKDGFDIDGYDNYYRNQYPDRKYDIIICQYVLNVLEQNEQAQVLMQVSELLKPTGKAYFTVRRDLSTEGFRLHVKHKKYTYQSNVILPFESIFVSDSFEIYQYQHYNQICHEKRDNNCPFCNLATSVELLSETATAVAFFDIYPVSKGHTLIIPKRHVADYFNLSIHEQRALWMLANRCKELLTERFNPDGFNVGINVGKFAGQSIFHSHIHIIPRYNGDILNPRGGVRGVIPEKKNY